MSLAIQNPNNSPTDNTDRYMAKSAWIKILRPVVPNAVYLNDEYAQYWESHHNFYLVPASQCQKVYTFLRDQPSEQGWMSLRFHAEFINYCIKAVSLDDNISLEHRTPRTWPQKVVSDMLQEYPTNADKYINALHAVYEEHIQQQDLSTDHMDGYIHHAQQGSYYLGLKHLYTLSFSAHDRRTHFHTTATLLASLFAQIAAEDSQIMDERVKAWGALFVRAQEPGVDRDLADFLAGLNVDGFSYSGVGLVSAMISRCVDAAWSFAGINRLSLPAELED